MSQIHANQIVVSLFMYSVCDICIMCIRKYNTCIHTVTRIRTDVVDAFACVCIWYIILYACVCNIDDVDFVYFNARRRFALFFMYLCNIYLSGFVRFCSYCLPLSSYIQSALWLMCNRFTRSNSFVCTINRLYPSCSLPDDFTNTSPM